MTRFATAIVLVGCLVIGAIGCAKKAPAGNGAASMEGSPEKAAMQKAYSGGKSPTAPTAANEKAGQARPK